MGVPEIVHVCEHACVCVCVHICKTWGLWVMCEDLHLRLSWPRDLKGEADEEGCPGGWEQGTPSVQPEGVAGSLGVVWLPP